MAALRGKVRLDPDLALALLAKRPIGKTKHLRASGPVVSKVGRSQRDPDCMGSGASPPVADILGGDPVPTNRTEASTWAALPASYLERGGPEHLDLTATPSNPPGSLHRRFRGPPAGQGDRRSRVASFVADGRLSVIQTEVVLVGPQRRSECEHGAGFLPRRSGRSAGCERARTLDEANPLFPHPHRPRRRPGWGNRFRSAGPKLRQRGRAVRAVRYRGPAGSTSAAVTGVEPCPNRCLHRDITRGLAACGFKPGFPPLQPDTFPGLD